MSDAIQHRRIVDRLRAKVWQFRRALWRRYVPARLFWNAVSTVLCMSLVSVWLFVYTDWISKAEAAVSFIGIGAVLAIFAKSKTHDDEQKEIDKLLRRPAWLWLPVVLLCAWCVSLLWGTLAVRSSAGLRQNVVTLRATETNAIRRLHVKSDEWTKVRLPLWKSRSWQIEADDYPQPQKTVGPFSIATVTVPFDLLEPQLYIRPTPVLSRTAPSRKWRLRVRRNNTDLPPIEPYLGHGVLYGGTYRQKLSSIPPAGLLERPDVFIASDTVEVIVERSRNGQWERYTGVKPQSAGPFNEYKLREIEIDVPLSQTTDDDTDLDDGDDAAGSDSGGVSTSSV